MIKTSEFWSKEGEAPLLGLDHGYFKGNTDKVVQIAQDWKASLFPTSFVLPASHKAHEGAIPEDFTRIFVKDAERTFMSPENRTKMINLLSDLFLNFGDYSQSLGYVASFLLLVLDREDAVVILEHLNFSEKYIPQYWKAQAVAFGVDAFVFQALLEKFHPAVGAHLLKSGIFPNTYCQKWFSGLCIHVLPFETLVEFFDRFFKQGYPFLFKFGLALVQILQKPLLATTNPPVIFELLRLEPKNKEISKEIGKEILAIVDSGTYADLGDLVELRKVAYDTKIKPQMEAAQRRNAEPDSDDEIVFSDEEEEEGKKDDDDDEEDEEVAKDLAKLELKKAK